MQKNLSLKNKYLANLRFLHPDYRKMEGEKMILSCASSMPPNFKLTSREMDALSIEWKQLILQDIPKAKKGDDHIPLNVYWKSIFKINDFGEIKFPNIKKVARFALSIAEANEDIERLFSQVSHVISKDRNKLKPHTIKGLLITKSFLQTNGTCLSFSLDHSMMNSIRAASSRYFQRQSDEEETNIKSLHKRVLEDTSESLKGNKKLKELERKKLQIEKQEEEMKLKRSQIKMLLEQAHNLMEDSEKMSKFICSEKTNLEKAEKQVQKSVIKSTCQKVVKEKLKHILPPLDINNNEVDSESESN